MNITRKGLVRNSSYLLIKLCVNLFVSLYCIKIVLNELGVVDYGIYNIVGGVVALGVILSGSLSVSTQRFFSFELGKEDNDIDEYYASAIIVFIILSLILLFLSQTIGLWFVNEKLSIPVDRSPIVNQVYNISIATFLFSIFTSPFNALLVALEKMREIMIFGLLVTAAKLIFVISLTYIEYEKILIYSILMLILSVLTFLLPFVYILAKVNRVKFTWVWDARKINEILSFSGWSLLGNMAYVGYTQGVNIILNINFGPVVNAARGVSIQVNNAVLGFSNNLLLAINPRIIKLYSSNEIQSMKILVENGSRYTYILTLFLITPLLFNLDGVLALWLDEVPQYTGLFIRMILIDTLVCSLSGTLITSVQATGRIRGYQIILGGILLMNIPLSIYFISIFNNPVVPMVVTLFLSIMSLFVRLIYMRVNYSLDLKGYSLRVIFPCVMSTLIILFLNVLFLNCTNFSLFYNAVYSVFIASLAVYFVALKEDERTYARGVISNLFVRFKG